MTRTVGVWIVVVLMGLSAYAQSSKPRFEVASIKPTVPVTSGPLNELLNRIPRFHPGGLFSAPQATVRDLLILAHDLRPNRIVGGPDWVRQDSFEVNARAGTNASANDMKPMIQSLLEDRFKLVTHVESREMRYQALVRARPDGPLSAGLEPLEECSSTVVNELRRKFPEKYPFPMNGLVSGCSKPGLENLAALLESRLDVSVVDATGLKGSFYFTIRSQWPAGPSRAEVTDANLPSLATALEEQLGLRLESRKGPLDVLVIDSIEQPTEN